MKNAKFMIVVFCLVVLAMAGEASAVPSVITTSGDHILVNGNPTFIVGSHKICGEPTDQITWYESCSESIVRNPELKYQFFTRLNTVPFWNSGHMDTMKNAGVFVSIMYGEGWGGSGWWNGDNTIVNKIFDNNLHKYSNFFGYHIDEPSGTHGNTRAKLLDLYDYIKSKDTDHPVMMNICCYRQFTAMI